MRLTSNRTGLLAAMALAALALSFAPAAAGGYVKERVYDDSFGNLIILSPTGYKRIVVGMGHVAVEMEVERRREAAAWVPPVGHPPAYGHCHRPPVLWKGRGYMYGLADGEIPRPPLVCK
ncbi:MAG: hypothetical protein JJ913_04855 [Rhizobiaceae bacterium]|nr:hypothetical protein [Rhizobiaceae bacterium]